MTGPVFFLRSYPLSWRNICVLVLLVTVFINEYVVYLVQTYRWPSFPVGRSEDPSQQQVILLVADPQLQGYQDEHGFPIGQLSRWDIDRYLRTTFSYAYYYSQPDVVLFLGDLFDEGSKARGGEYRATLDRFDNIFSPSKLIKRVIIPGDNDIGGEMADRRTDQKISRFVRNFEDLIGVTKYSFIDYIKLDLLPHSLSDEKIRRADYLASMLTGTFPVLINHSPLFTPSKQFLYPVLKRLRPHLILCGHWHRVSVEECDDCLVNDSYSWSIKHRPVEDLTSFIQVNITQNSVVQIQTPACSYRMGVRDIGYGVLIIGSDKQVHYSVLWLPRRYVQLKAYLVVICFLLVSWCLDTVLRCRGWVNRNR